MITAYNVRTKEKGVEVHDAVITKTAKGALLVQGHVKDEPTQKLTTLVNKNKAAEAFQNGWAKPGWTDDVQAAIAELTTPPAAAPEQTATSTEEDGA